MPKMHTGIAQWMRRLWPRTDVRYTNIGDPERNVRLAWALKATTEKLYTCVQRRAHVSKTWPTTRGDEEKSLTTDRKVLKANTRETKRRIRETKNKINIYHGINPTTYSKTEWPE